MDMFTSAKKDASKEGGSLETSRGEESVFATTVAQSENDRKIELSKDYKSGGEKWKCKWGGDMWGVLKLSRSATPFYRAEGGTPFDQLRCKRRSIVVNSKEYFSCPGTLLSIGHEKGVMRTVEKAVERAERVNLFKRKMLSHGCRLSCNRCGDKPPSKQSSTKPTKLRSWQEWCTICREVWCNQSFHMKHGGIAKKGGEKPFKGRVKDHKKRLWCIHVALWLLKNFVTLAEIKHWLVGSKKSGLAALLPLKISKDEMSRILMFVMRELKTIGLYVKPGSVSEKDGVASGGGGGGGDRDCNVGKVQSNVSSTQTWPPAKRARTPTKRVGGVSNSTTAAVVTSEKPITESVSTLVDMRIPTDLRLERSWLLSAMKKYLSSVRPLTLKEAIKSMAQDAVTCAFVFPTGALGELDRTHTFSGKAYKANKRAARSRSVPGATEWQAMLRTTANRRKRAEDGPIEHGVSTTPRIPMAMPKAFPVALPAVVDPVYYASGHHVPPTPSLDMKRLRTASNLIARESADSSSPMRSAAAAHQTWPPRKRERPESLRLPQNRTTGGVGLDVMVAGKGSSSSTTATEENGMQEAATALMMMGIKNA